MHTECHEKKLEFKGLGGRRVEADFGGGQLSSDGGGLLLREAANRVKLMQRLSACFDDHRKAELIEHSVEELLSQRIYGLALGYEDLEDHHELSRDPLLATMAGKVDPEGKHRRNVKNEGMCLASPSTLGRLERTKEDASAASRYEKIVCNFEKLGELFVQIFIEQVRANTREEAPQRVVLDIDPTDIELHGTQEQRFYHGYYGHYCYLPMYVFCGDYPLGVVLRPSNIDGAKGAKELLAPIVWQLREAFVDTHIILRADSGFCRDELMSWCEAEGIDYVFGIAKNQRLCARIEKQMRKAQNEHLQTGRAARRFRSFMYRTRDSWSRSRRVVGKAEYLSKGANPRFVVTSLSGKEFEKRYVYEELYCARGEMENRIKEQQLGLFADRASAHTFRANHVRLWMSMAAHLLIVILREQGLAHSKLARAQAPTLRNKLLKIGAHISVSVRRVFVRLSSAFPLQEVFVSALQRLRSPPASLIAR